MHRQQLKPWNHQCGIPGRVPRGQPVVTNLDERCSRSCKGSSLRKVLIGVGMRVEIEQGRFVIVNSKHRKVIKYKHTDRERYAYYKSRVTTHFVVMSESCFGQQCTGSDRFSGKSLTREDFLQNCVLPISIQLCARAKTS